MSSSRASASWYRRHTSVAFSRHPLVDTQTLGLASHNADVFGNAPQLLSQRKDVVRHVCTPTRQRSDCLTQP